MFRSNEIKQNNAATMQSEVLIIQSNTNIERSILEYLLEGETTVEVPDWASNKKTFWLTNKKA